MKLTTRIVSLLLAALCVCTTACSGGGEPVETTAAPVETTAPAETEPVETEPVDPRMLVKDDLPEDLTFDGKTFNIYVGDIYTNRVYIGGPEELTGDLVEDAVFKRNLMLEDRLKIDIETHAVADAWNTIATSVSNFILANDSTFDLFVGHQIGMATVASRQLFMNVYDLPHFNFEQPWWDNGYMEELSLGNDIRYLLSGDFFMHTLHETNVLYFNKNLYEDFYGDPDNLYRQALDGSWLFENMNTMVTDVYADLNNNGKSDMEDRLGFVNYKMFASTDPFVYGSGIDFTTRDADGFLKINMVGNEKCADLLNSLLDFFWQDAVCTETDSKHGQIFMEGRSLFLGGRLGTMGSLRGMEQDFAPLPYPKHDIKQENYLSMVHDGAMIGGVPISSLNHDLVGAVLEAGGAESYRSVYPAYYETSLKVKYARDTLSAQIVDLIKETKGTNFIYAYTTSLGEIGTIYRILISNKNSGFASQAKIYQRMAEKKMEDLIVAFTAQ